MYHSWLRVGGPTACAKDYISGVYHSLLGLEAPEGLQKLLTGDILQRISKTVEEVESQVSKI